MRPRISSHHPDTPLSRRPFPFFIELSDVDEKRRLYRLTVLEQELFTFRFVFRIKFLTSNGSLIIEFRVLYYLIEF